MKTRISTKFSRASNNKKPRARRRDKAQVPAPGSRAFESAEIIELDKRILELKKELRQLKHERKMLIKRSEKEV